MPHRNVLVSGALWCSLVAASNASGGELGQYIASYEFNEGTGKVANDESGYGPQLKDCCNTNLPWGAGGVTGHAGDTAIAFALLPGGITGTLPGPGPNGNAALPGITLEAWVQRTGDLPTPNAPGSIVSAYGATIGLASNFMFGKIQCANAFQEWAVTEPAEWAPGGNDIYDALELPVPGGGNSWVHVMLTYDGVALKLYRDGQLLVTNDTSLVTSSGNGGCGPVAYNNGAFTVGANFGGVIDEVRVALGPNDVAGAHNSGASDLPWFTAMFDTGAGFYIDAISSQETNYESGLLVCAGRGTELCSYSQVATAIALGVTTNVAQPRFRDMLWGGGVGMGNKYYLAGGGGYNGHPAGTLVAFATSDAVVTSANPIGPDNAGNDSYWCCLPYPQR